MAVTAAPAAPQAWTLWVKVKYTGDSRTVEYAPVRGVSPDATVYDLKELYVVAHGLGVAASLLALRLAGSAPGVLPSEEEEAQAVPLNNTAAKLCEVSVTEGSWVLAVHPAPTVADTQRQLLETLKALPDRIAELAAGQERLVAGQERLVTGQERLVADHDRLVAGQERLTDRLASLERRLLDPWEFLSTTSDSSRTRTGFHKLVSEFYYGLGAQPTCMVTGLTAKQGGGQNEVQRELRAAHIWPYNTAGRGLDHFGLSRGDVHRAANGLMLLKPIETAFDEKRVAFEYCGDDDAFIFRVLDPLLLEGTVSEQWTFGHFEGKPLRLPRPEDGICTGGRPAFPFRRLLAWHFSQALQKALDRRWKTEEELQHYFVAGAEEKVRAWLDNTSPGSKWPGQRAVGLHALRAAQAGSAASSEDGEY